MLVHGLFHDIGEVATGDLPFPTKLRNPDLKKIMDGMENSTHLSMCIRWGVPSPVALTDEEKRIFKCADYIEMWEWALDEFSLGNKMAEPVFHRCLDEIEKLMGAIPHEIVKKVKYYLARRADTYGSYAIS